MIRLVAIMRIANLKIIFIGLIVYECLCPSIYANADTSQGIIVPVDLHQYAISKNCTPVGDFYAERPGVISPPYVYAAEADGSEPAAALWCREKKEDRDEYTLLFRQGTGSVGQRSCPQKIAHQERIGGLSLLKIFDLKLNKFRFVENPSKFSRSSKKIQDISIKSEYDGVGTIFYCFKGEWLFYLFD
jgi:hypothetical protein